MPFLPIPSLARGSFYHNFLTNHYDKGSNKIIYTEKILRYLYSKETKFGPKERGKCNMSQAMIDGFGLQTTPSAFYC